MLNPLQLLFGHPAMHPSFGAGAAHSAAPGVAAPPFASLFGTQLGNLQLAAGPMPAGLAETSALGVPGQVFAGGGEALPATPPSGTVIEVFSYSRLVVSDAAGQPVTAFGQHDPRADLATVLSHLGAHSESAAPAAAEMPLVAAPLAPEPPAPIPAESPAKRIDPDEVPDKIGQSVVRLAEAGIPDAELAVRHPEYGWIEASVSRDAEGVSLSFGIENADLRGVLEAARGGIAEILAGAGLNLTGFSVQEPEHGIDPAAVAESNDPAEAAAAALSRNAFLTAALDSTLADTALRLVNARA